MLQNEVQVIHVTDLCHFKCVAWLGLIYRNHMVRLVRKCNAYQVFLSCLAMLTRPPFHWTEYTLLIRIIHLTKTCHLQIW